MKRLARAVAFLSIMLGGGDAFAQEMQVGLQGAVVRPGAYAMRKGDRLSSLIERGGGFTDNAWLPGAALSRESARAQKEPLLRGIVSAIERELAAGAGDEEAKREFLGRLSALAPGNRSPVRLRHPRLLKGSGDDLPLEDGDVLHVPSRTDAVTVVGAVKMPGAVSSPSPNGDPEDHIRNAGGYTDDADRKHAYLLRANTAVTPLSRGWIRWNPADSRWEIPAFREPAPRVEPGDTIVVPKRPARSHWARDVEHLPQLLMRIHSLTGVRVDLP